MATNFLNAARALVESFETTSTHRIRLVSGSTGKLYAQIVNGAPYDAFLAADRARPERLMDEGRASTLRTYAVGRLALWSADSTLLAADGPTALREQPFRHLAMANPDLAPYGLAARQTLENLELLDLLLPRIVMGENVGQAHAMIASGAAELGFIALSYLRVPGEPPTGSCWLVPASLHEPVRQAAVLLNRGAGNPAASGFLEHLNSAVGRSVIRRFGYDTPP